MSTIVEVLWRIIFVGTLAGLAWWSAEGTPGRRAAKTLGNAFLLWLSIGRFVGVALYFALRRTYPRLARSALGVQLIGTPFVVGLMMLSP